MSGMRRISLEEMRKLLLIVPVKYRAILAFGIGCGCRISEILCLKRVDLIDDGRLRDEFKLICLKKGNNERVYRVKFRKMAMPDFFRSFVIEHLECEANKGYELADDWVFRGAKGKAMGRLSVYVWFRRFLGKGYGTHFMRKTFAFEIFYGLCKKYSDVMVSLGKLKGLLGHCQIDTTIRYLGIDDECNRIIGNEVFCFND